MRDTQNHYTTIYGVRYIHTKKSGMQKTDREHKSSYMPHYVFLDCYFYNEEDAENVAQVYNLNYYKTKYYKTFKTTEERLQHLAGNFYNDSELREKYPDNSEKIMKYTIYDTSEDYFATLNEAADEYENER